MRQKFLEVVRFNFTKNFNNQFSVMNEKETAQDNKQHKVEEGSPHVP